MSANDQDLRERVAYEVTRALGDTGLRLSEAELDTCLRQLDLDGAELFEALVLDASGAAARERSAACFALGISVSTLHRVTGFGAWQARVLGGLSAERAGALFNLGIVLFDALLDRGNTEARNAALEFDLSTLGPADRGPELAFFQRIARRFFEVCENASLGPLLEDLLAAERACAGVEVADRPLLRAMRSKSVGPFLLMARLGGGRLDIARAFGRAVWIVDDLWDWQDDTASGSLGRPAVRTCSADTVVATELRCLRAALASAEGWPAEARACLAATVAAWVRMPRPQPLFARTMR